MEAQELINQYPDQFRMSDGKIEALVGEDGSAMGQQFGELVWSEMEPDFSISEVEIYDYEVRTDKKQIILTAMTELGWRDILLMDFQLALTNDRRDDVDRSFSSSSLFGGTWGDKGYF